MHACRLDGAHCSSCALLHRCSLPSAPSLQAAAKEGKRAAELAAALPARLKRSLLYEVESSGLRWACRVCVETAACRARSSSPHACPLLPPNHLPSPRPSPVQRQAQGRRRGGRGGGRGQRRARRGAAAAGRSGAPGGARQPDVPAALPSRRAGALRRAGLGARTPTAALNHLRPCLVPSDLTHSTRSHATGRTEALDRQSMCAFSCCCAAAAAALPAD